MFDDVAERYDLTNTVLSFGQDKGWRKATREALDLKPGEKVLDLAAGTGVSTVELGRSGAWVASPPTSPRECSRPESRAKFRWSQVTRCTCPMPTTCSTPRRFPSACATSPTSKPDCVRSPRVTKPGGRLVVSEFSTPVFGPFRTVYMEYLMKALPQVARTVSSKPRRLRVPRRIDPRLADPGRVGPQDRGCRLEERQVAQPHRRHRGAALRHCLNCCAPLSTPGG